jgi:hypothetical protein
LKGAVQSVWPEESRYFRWPESEAEGTRKWAAQAKIAFAGQLICPEQQACGVELA